MGADKLEFGGFLYVITNYPIFINADTVSFNIYFTHCILLYQQKICVVWYFVDNGC